MTLRIDSSYYNKLDIEGFSQMMKSPTCCYKFYWLEALVLLISEERTSATYDEIINEMIANAWYTVLEYHVHLSGLFGGNQMPDALERAIKNLQDLCRLPNNAIKEAIKEQISIHDKALHAEKMELIRYVPVKALSGFANKGEEKVDLDSSAGRLIEYYNRLNQTSILLPYTFGNECGLNKTLVFNKEWIQMIKDNTVAILGWIQYEKVKWLQNNNPEIPGLVYKLTIDGEKERKLEHVHKLWDAILELVIVEDVFKGEPVNKEKYDVDHFIPRAFVMHDELWNLMPMDSSLNSEKGAKLPKWEPFFARFANNQFLMYQMIYDDELPKLRKLYEGCHRDNLHSVWANQELYRCGNSQVEFYNILERNMRPVYDSARRQGYVVWEEMEAS